MTSVESQGAEQIAQSWVLDAVQMGLIVLNNEGRIVLFNHWMAQRSGLASAEVVGRTLDDVFPEVAKGRVGKAVQACLNTGFPSLLSNSLHPTPFPLFTGAPQRLAGERVQQSVRIQALPVGTGRQVLIEVGDVSGAVRRERMLTQQAVQLKTLSAMDSLTGLANRRSLDEVLEREFRRAARSSHSVAVVLVDIDAFKLYNDTYGHQAGDRCLTEVARVLRQSLKRPGDLAARYGGEEFLLILPETDLQGAVAVARTMRVEVEAMGLLHTGSAHHGVITISQGVAATIPGKTDTFEDLLAQADVALYAAKRAGRNRVAAMHGATELAADIVQASSG
ncbi:MAG TPA: sensor domain-containing diguanylate cyclase [Rhodoferax sp.]|nr:sensor domain-containing diguanylate cyclase [Rhodoferax sp.]